MSTPEVTITLGRSGQVVKRKRANFEGAQYLSHRTKRQRDMSVKENVGHGGENGLHLDRNDLRYKLIQRRLSNESRTAARSNERREKSKEAFSGVPARSSISSNVLQHGRQSQRDARFLGDPYGEASRDSPYVESSRNYYSTVTRDDLRQRSPARLANNSNCLSVTTYKDKMPKVTPIRSIDPLGSQHAYNNTLRGPSRLTVSAHAMTIMESDRAKPVPLYPSSSSIIPRSSFMVEAPMTVAGLLNSLGLEKYAIQFKHEEVDMTALKQMGEKDLKDLGIPMGPRKKILQALSALSKRQLPGQR